jgi:blue copper oxidase
MFEDRRDMHLIATDAGYLPQPRAILSLRMSPGERAEVLVDFSDGRPVRMISGRGQMAILDFAPDARIRRRIDRLPDRLAEDLPPLSDAPAPVRRFSLNTGGGFPSAAARASVPDAPDERLAEAIAAMVAAGWPEEFAREVCASPSVGAVLDTGAARPEDSRHLPHDFAINGRSYDPARIDFHVPLGQRERWIISGGGAAEHPFHVHGVHFRVLSEGGAAPRAENAGWKDTVLAAGQIEIEVRFDHRADPLFPYMYHCHILEHEDAGMMGQFSVG